MTKYNKTNSGLEEKGKDTSLFDGGTTTQEGREGVRKKGKGEKGNFPEKRVP